MFGWVRVWVLCEQTVASVCSITLAVCKAFEIVRGTGHDNKMSFSNSLCFILHFELKAHTHEIEELLHDERCILNWVRIYIGCNMWV